MSSCFFNNPQKIRIYSEPEVKITEEKQNIPKCNRLRDFFPLSHSLIFFDTKINHWSLTDKLPDSVKIHSKSPLSCLSAAETERRYWLFCGKCHCHSIPPCRNRVLNYTDKRDRVYKSVSVKRHIICAWIDNLTFLSVGSQICKSMKWQTAWGFQKYSTCIAFLKNCTQDQKHIFVPYIYIFIAVALDENSILVAVHFSKNIYRLCDLVRAVRRSNVNVSQ